MKTPHLHIVHLYPVSMSTYGDRGNIITIEQRLRWRGFEVTVQGVEVGDPLPKQADFYFFGGGQDVAQTSAGIDLQSKREQLSADVESGVPLLAICGGYQLLGGAYHPANQEPIPGAGILPVVTHASSTRMIGNLLVEANSALQLPMKNTIVGFENHSGKTTFTDASAQPLGRVLQGSGNNGNDATEGCIYRNAIGCYLHGSLLPKNPHLADWFISKAFEHSLQEGVVLPALDDDLAWQAHQEILRRYR